MNWFIYPKPISNNAVFTLEGIGYMQHKCMLYLLQYGVKCSDSIKITINFEYPDIPCMIIVRLYTCTMDIGFLMQMLVGIEVAC